MIKGGTRGKEGQTPTTCICDRQNIPGNCPKFLTNVANKMFVPIEKDIRGDVP